MLGDEVTPLMSYEQAAEQLNNGEFSENIKNVEQERNALKNLTPAPAPVAPIQTLKGDNIDVPPGTPPAAPAKPTKKVKKDAANK